MKEKEYIVKKSQIMNAVGRGLSELINDVPLAQIFEAHIEDYIDVVLEDDCDEMTDDGNILKILTFGEEDRIIEGERDD